MFRFSFLHLPLQYSIGSLLHTHKKKLLTIKGISEAKADKLILLAQKASSSANKFRNAAEVEIEREEAVFKITTGSKELDALLGGGVESQSLTEVYGEFRTGKSQLAHMLAVTTQGKIEDGGAMGSVIIIDTEGAWRGERVKQIATTRFGLSGDEVLSNIRVATCYTNDGLANVCDEAAALCADPSLCVKLLIVDSIMALARVQYQGRGELADRQCALGRILKQLKTMAVEYNIAVLVTNQVMSSPDAAGLVGPPIAKACGGHVLAHAVTTRIQFKKGRGAQRKCKLHDSPTLAEAECEFYITAGGIADEE